MRNFFRGLRRNSLFGYNRPIIVIRNLRTVPLPEGLHETIETSILRIRDRLSSIPAQSVYRSLKPYLKKAIRTLRENDPVRFAMVNTDLGVGAATIEREHFIMINQDALDNIVHLNMHHLDGSIERHSMESVDYLEYCILWGIMAINAGTALSKETTSNIGCVAELAFPIRPPRPGE